MRWVVFWTLVALSMQIAGVGAAAAQAGLPPVFAAKSPAQVIRLAQRGNAKAQAQLGWMYENGRGVPQNYYQAAKWLAHAADRGNGWAQYELGLLYNKGEGVPRDYVLSYMWLNLSASHAKGRNRDFLERMRDSVALKMTPAQLATGQGLALSWRRSR